MITQTKNYDINYKIQPSFTMNEFISPDGLAIWNNEIYLFSCAVQEFRNWYNRAMNISSWYRSPSHNKKIGGASNSMHLYGMAIDCPYPIDYYSRDSKGKKDFENNISNKWYEICQKYGWNGSIEIATRHFHLDNRKWIDNKFHRYTGESK